VLRLHATSIARDRLGHSWTPHGLAQAQFYFIRKQKSELSGRMLRVSLVAAYSADSRGDAQGEPKWAGPVRRRRLQRSFQSYGFSVQPIPILIHVLNSKLFKTKNIQIQNCSKPKMFKF
jgi:hypothetical protein